MVVVLAAALGVCVCSKVATVKLINPAEQAKDMDCFA